MLGHRLWLTLNENHDVYATIRGNETAEVFSKLKHLTDKTFFNVDILDLNAVERVICRVKPDIVFNCVGIIKQLKESKSNIISLEVNSLVPHRVAQICEQYKARFVHFSTDCVFDGATGNYQESDDPNSQDLYGRSKLMGEVDNLKNSLTLRTSIIGRELHSKKSLVEWFLNEPKVNGYSKAIFSGFPTYTLSKLIEKYVLPNSDLWGTWHVSNEPISKLDLLKLINEKFNLSKEISIDEDFSINRSLNSDQFRTKTGFSPDKWENIISDLLIEDSLYHV